MTLPFNARMDTEGAWRAEVDTGEGKWFGNGLSFDSESDALDYARDLASRWTLVQQYQAVPMSTPLREPVRINDGPDCYCTDCGRPLVWQACPVCDRETVQ